MTLLDRPSRSRCSAFLAAISYRKITPGLLQALRPSNFGRFFVGAPEFFGTGSAPTTEIGGFAVASR